MSFDFRAFMPNRISGQIALLVSASLIASQIVLTVSLIYYRPFEPPERLPDQLAILIRLIAANPSEQREALMASIDRAFPRFNLQVVPRPPADVPASPVLGPELERFVHRLGQDYRVISDEIEPLPAPAVEQRVVIGLPGGQFIAARFAPMPPPPLLIPFMITWVMIATLVPVLSLWAAFGLTGPLRRFALAAENFDPNCEIAPIPARGPQEVRVAVRAFNRMSERVKALIDDRTRMLAALSHDLRTPITRLRLHCEFIEDEATRARIMVELMHMESMVESVLQFLRSSHAAKQAVALDLATSLQAICDQFADTGHDVSYNGPDHMVVHAHPADLHRAVTNLIDNAVRYGGKADVKLVPTPQAVTIIIEDNGPGIPDSSKQAMFEPFVRGDAARSMNNNAGFGLGLPIARAVIEAHRGTLTLLDREPHGLVAQVILPQRDEEPV
jgi:signal transduction histidine kinase